MHLGVIGPHIMDQELVATLVQSCLAEIRIGSLPDFCQTFEGHLLLRAPELFQPGRNPRLFACLWQKLEEEDRLPIDYESHALTI